MKFGVDTIRECLDGAIPGVMATCSPDGVPNATYVSEVHYVDGGRVAMSFQFFNKTRENILANPRATVWVLHPVTGARYELAVEYLRTETKGPLFESMKAKLAGIASHTGMAGVFRLLGSDVYRVLAIRHVPGAELRAIPRPRNLLAALRKCALQIAGFSDLSSLFDGVLACLEASLDIHHAMLLLLDAPAGKLYTVATRGYGSSGVGSEIPLGEGVIGIAARERTPIRIAHATTEFGYGRAIRRSMLHDATASVLDTEIPLPGLPGSSSQLAVPIVAGDRLLGVLYVESPEDRRFGYDDEDALVALAAQLAVAIHHLQHAAEGHADTPRNDIGHTPVTGPPAVIKRYCANDSVFVDDDYLIKGVAGAILWKLVSDYARGERTEFTNRELRLDPCIRLPDVTDNLEARLILLQRRLAERAAPVRIEKTGRGRFRLCVSRPIELLEIPR
jgi:hypothetical protein